MEAQPSETQAQIESSRLMNWTMLCALRLKDPRYAEKPPVALVLSRPLTTSASAVPARERSDDRALADARLPPESLDSVDVPVALSTAAGCVADGGTEALSEGCCVGLNEATRDGMLT